MQVWSPVIFVITFDGGTVDPVEFRVGCGQVIQAKHAPNITALTV